MSLPPAKRSKPSITHSCARMIIDKLFWAKKDSTRSGPNLTILPVPSGSLVSFLFSVFENMNFYCTTLQILFYGQNTNFDLYNKYNVQMFCKMKIIWNITSTRPWCCRNQTGPTKANRWSFAQDRFEALGPRRGGVRWRWSPLGRSESHQYLAICKLMEND